MRGMATEKGSGLFVARSSPAFTRPPFQAFHATGRLDQPFTVFQEVRTKIRQLIRGRTLMGHAEQAMTAHLLLTERPDVSQHLPGFFFRQHERNKRGHRRTLAAVLQNPE